MGFVSRRPAAQSHQPSAPASGLPRRRHGVPLGIAKPRGWSSVIGPAVFASIAVGLLVFDHVQRQVTDVVFWFTLALVATIFVWLVSKAAMAVAREHSSARVDELTGLASREQLDSDLARALAPGAHERWVLVVIELDGLPVYNDNRGHGAGDELLRDFARSLADVAGGLDGSAYRIEGSGFAVLAPTATSPAGAIVTAVNAVTPQDDDEQLIETSQGDVCVPEEAGDPRAALEIASQRRRARKQRQRRSARGQLRQVLLEVVAARRPELRNQAPDLAHWIIAVSHELDLQQEQLDDIVLAADLRDIGLLTVPEAVMTKGADAGERERELIRRHPIAGHRILHAAPALAAPATLVRSANEHFDGSGYPDGLAGTAIPLGSRLIAVCVAFAALTSSAARAAVSPHEALAELSRRAGTQFDPQVVEALANVIHDTSPEDRTRARPDRLQRRTPAPPRTRSVPA
ncbi:MAG TPA: HD domain-containing phosphohydrolase [Solirubrobacteraceae bacterium]